LSAVRAERNASRRGVLSEMIALLILILWIVVCSVVGTGLLVAIALAVTDWIEERREMRKLQRGKA
jgi:ABC-type dipeptide/oligopeptide/nickel transport system permease subunit